MIPSSDVFDQPILTALLEHDPVVEQYRACFSLVDWSVVDDWQAQRSARGGPAHPESAYLKAFLIRQYEGMISTSQLRRFLLKHPLLVIELGFHLVLDPTTAYGFEVDKTLPCRYWFTQKLRLLDPALLQALLHAPVAALQQESAGLGEVVAFDVKPIYAWVKENNPRAYVKDRSDKERRLSGDPDCKLGVKRSSNQDSSEESEQQQGPSTQEKEPLHHHHKSKKKANKAKPEKEPSSNEKKEYIWGYGSGVATATVPDYGDVILAEYTQPFNEADVTYFRPLYEPTVIALNHYPTPIAADAAYDAWYTYECAARHGGIGAIPLNGHGHGDTACDRDAVPICRQGLRMVPTFQFQHSKGYRAQRFCCPLLVPIASGETCDHPQVLKGIGCRKDPNWELGGRMRVTLDRTSPLYKIISNQRTSAERINSRAQAIGIERPKVRNIHSVRNLNTLIYLVINVRVLAKAKSINKGLLLMN